MRKPSPRLLLIAALLLVGGCGNTKGCRKDNSSGLTRLDALPPTAYGESGVAGTVTFDGQVPPRRQVGSSPTCGPVFDESVVVGPAGGLANVLVYLDGPPASSGVGTEPAVLDQEGCQFTPRVVAVQVGQPLRISNGDPMKHNVHYRPDANPDVNVAFADAGTPAATEVFAAAEPEPVRAACDIHPWMAAFIGVFDHPFFAVTDADGRYDIDRVPAGEYDLVAWHELYGERRAPVVVADAGPTTADLTFARR